MVVNAPDIGKIPETALLESSLGLEGFAKRASRLSQRFNHKLAKAVHNIEHDLDIDIVLFDLAGYLNIVLDNHLALEFANNTEACFSTVTGFHPECDGEKSFDDFVLFDDIHPTARVHERASRAMYSVVPEPMS